MTLGSLITALRQDCRLSQSELAQRVGVSKAFIGQLEKGDRIASLATLHRIADNTGGNLRLLLAHALKFRARRVIREADQWGFEIVVRDKGAA